MVVHLFHEKIEMQIASLKIDNFQGMKTGFVRSGKHAVLVGGQQYGQDNSD
ncbi:hypothetical protein W822_01585 [Advenella kashmirensis W13003]|uniref:Uncharacterized protein n=1 Tax=Advenella kashmirensis W13003 TaxID=1424334 RepID=V8QYE0_9BURK|nr:hypothetical protein W822_01585 [Advenella kashmirensis W13003]